MSTLFTFSFSALLIIIWIVAGGFITQSSVFLHATRDTDEFLHRAYWYAFWAAFITWTLVVIFIILIGLAIFGVVGLFSTGIGEEGIAAEAVEGNKLSSLTSSNFSWVTVIFLVFALILVFVTGVLSALTASNIKASKNYVETDARQHKAYTNAIIAAALCLGAGSLLIIGMITYFILSAQASSKAKAVLAAQQKIAQDNQTAVTNLKGDFIKRNIIQQLALGEARINHQIDALNSH
jgi:hypothetical protein